MFMAQAKWVWDEGRQEELLMVVANATKRGPGYLLKFSGSSFKLLSKKKLDNDPLQQLETSRDRGHLAVSSNESTISVFKAGSMSYILRKKEAHE